ncbi:hypothetical protein [Bradyrhizobium sp. CCGUVB23]|uniref:hypothetical protein n=1 Tax=Bradyrhizobium sp. CCGUVB23 TaxID=2949630 RepID=UPI0020B1D31A|nr:hypothetical protein [Bradyrhizobium sp. CCGUVB23]MCP3459197.1 hypothetical protein [Bradyrhizobium sp. CCGUVB23]
MREVVIADSANDVDHLHAVFEAKFIAALGFYEATAEKQSSATAQRFAICTANAFPQDLLNGGPQRRARSFGGSFGD